jgi:V/A-type H+-transporting ATPase subunit C
LKIYTAAMKYGYSNARVKGMESKLISSSVMKSIEDAKDVDSMLSILFQTDYNAAILKFGGLEINTTMLDFAVSENLASNLNKLADITPNDEKYIIEHMISGFDFNNIKMVLEAIDRHKKFDSISKYIVSSRRFGSDFLQDVMKADNINDAFSKLLRNRQYRNVLSKAYEAYKKTTNVMDAITTIDMEHYKEIGDLSIELTKTHHKSAKILKMDIDMRNIITLLKAKKVEMNFVDISANLIKNGSLSLKYFSEIYNNSDDINSFALKINEFDLKDAVLVYSENNHMLPFEISMRNQIFNKSQKLLEASVLSLNALVDYVYLKEAEVFTIRALIKGKEYGLSKEDISRLIIWRL